MKAILLALCLCAHAAAAAELLVGTFNCKWLGQSAKKENEPLAGLLAPYDVVLVQELVAPPAAGRYPDGTSYAADPQAAAFFAAMQAKGFTWWLSEEDTGPKKNHSAGTGSEWWVAFYRTNKVLPAMDLPHGFLAKKRAKNSSWDRVPYAFSFRAQDASCDFVLISVHLHPTEKSLKTDSLRRQKELAAIVRWIKPRSAAEKDFWIVGDMNIDNLYEFRAIRPMTYVSLNDECDPTTNGKVKKPFDHVLFQAYYSPEVSYEYGFRVQDIRQYLSAHYPGAATNSADFAFRYSDHNPAGFQIKSTKDDD